MSDVIITEVGLRDGLQAIQAVMPTALKFEWVRLAYEAGLRSIEAGSFVPVKLLPQLGDTALVVKQALALPGMNVCTLVPNLRGADAAFAAGAHEIVFPLSASAAHSRANIRKTPEEAIAELRRICELRDAQPAGARPQVIAGISTAFGCTIQGEVPEADVERMAIAAADAGVDAIGLGDTTGYANPAQVRRLYRRLRAAVGERVSGAHFHDTRGLALANVVAALDCGIRNFDSSLAGLGGCPHAPGATGNVATEDLVFMLESMGLDTGVDVEKLVASRELLKRSLPGEALYGHIERAGLTKTYRRAA
jgi:hydroxymethylglutaryl-CoA lyase